MPSLYPQRAGRGFGSDRTNWRGCCRKAFAEIRARQAMMFSHRFAALLFALLIPAFAVSVTGALAQSTVTSAPPASFTLANGLQVIVIPDHRTPVVTQMIWYKVGSADETPGKSGLAHFLEHLMFKGTSKHPAGEFSQTVLRIGGNENAFTAVDYTGYFQDRKSTRLNSSHEWISYAVFCLKKKILTNTMQLVRKFVELGKPIDL